MRSIIIFSIGALVVAAQSAKRTAPLGSTVFEWTQLAAKATKTGERREVTDGPTATFTNLEAHITTIEAGLSPHAPHRHPDEEIVILKEGVLEVLHGGKTERAGPGSILFFASNDEHGMKNVGATRATYYVIRSVTGSTPK